MSKTLQFDFTINIPAVIAVIGVICTLAVSVYRIGELERQVRGLAGDLKGFAKDVATTTATLDAHMRTEKTSWTTPKATSPGAP